MAMSADKYLSQLKALLPPGAAWPRDKDAELNDLLLALADEFARVDDRAEILTDEADPRTTYELLPDWERVAGLPDSCVGELDTIQQRRDALVGRLTDAGGQSPQFFLNLAQSLGYTVTVTEFRPARVDVTAVGDPIYDEQWIFAWQVNAPETTIIEAAVDTATAGESLRTWGNTLLECIITRWRPAHTHVIFAYG